MPALVNYYMWDRVGSGWVLRHRMAHMSAGAHVLEALELEWGARLGLEVWV